ncbi:DsbA family oxidoreductase [Rhodococcus opacus]|uniref:DsbA family oxidoreductase n=1 Tax=Rhodococcus opacus TaxID=37919 RepID=UPI0029532AE3|nr:DsbA family oxidoreductase [Rhodococcus opacus]MDV7089137.1 DsbA family oxidoreductase [Rhodococcus opacus]
MKIEFWSDIVCPYCGLMNHRLHQALESFEHAADVHLVHRSFQIHPDLPREGVTQWELLKRAGVTSIADQVLRPIERQAAAEGLTPYRVMDRTLGPTDLAHELLAHATDRGRGNEAWTAMYRTHFGQARKLWTTREVLDFAAQLGLDREEAAKVLDDRRYRARVSADQREAQRRGARGVPFLVIDGSRTINGAIGTDHLLAAMTETWDAGHSVPQPLPAVAHGDGVCGSDGCVIPGTQRS